jgi:hypothetical protein
VRKDARLARPVVAREYFTRELLPKVGFAAIRNHITNIFSKLQVADRAQAIVCARDAGLGQK